MTMLKIRSLLFCKFPSVVKEIVENAFQLLRLERISKKPAECTQKENLKKCPQTHSTAEDRKKDRSQRHGDSAKINGFAKWILSAFHFPIIPFKIPLNILLLFYEWFTGMTSEPPERVKKKKCVTLTKMPPTILIASRLSSEQVKKKICMTLFAISIFSVLFSGAQAETLQSDFTAKVGQSLNMTYLNMSKKTAGENYTQDIYFTSSNNSSEILLVCTYYSDTFVTDYSDKFRHQEVLCLPGGIAISDATLNRTGTYSMDVNCPNAECPFSRYFNLTVEPAELTTEAFPTNTTTSAKDDGPGVALVMVTLVGIASIVAILIIIIIIICQHRVFQKSTESPMDANGTNRRLLNETSATDTSMV